MDRLEALIRDLSLRFVPVEVYSRDRTELERRLGEAERDVEAEREARKEADRELRQALDKQSDRQSGDRRQAFYGGVIPGLVVLVGIAVQIMLALRGGK